MGMNVNIKDDKEEFCDRYALGKYFHNIKKIIQELL